MAKAKNTTKDAGSLDIIEIQHETITLAILGRSPLIMNRMSQKAMHELLMPKGRKTAAEKAVSLKHDPMAEYRASPYTLKDDTAPTRLAMPAVAFKKAMTGIAVDIPGAKKAQVGRLAYVEGERVPIYGVPQLFMAVVRSADMNRTPDIRTRCIVPQWASSISVTFVRPLMRAQQIANLIAAAGKTTGVGDWRGEKGSGNYGQFDIVSPDDPRYLEIVASGGRTAQDAGLENPACYDDETTDLLAWFEDESQNRKLRGVA